jgi:hypothetical protein
MGFLRDIGLGKIGGDIDNFANKVVVHPLENITNSWGQTAQSFSSTAQGVGKGLSTGAQGLGAGVGSLGQGVGQLGQFLPIIILGGGAIALIQSLRK